MKTVILTAAELAEVDALKAVWVWIKKVRLASDALEISLPDSYADEIHWPTKPAED